MGALGAGLLVGTALSVIIPEGFHAFQSAQEETGEACYRITTGCTCLDIVICTC